MADTSSVRVLTWNVWGLRGGAGRVVAVLRAARADVVCLQECPRAPGGRTLLRLLARRAGLRVVAGGGRAGVAVLTRPGVSVVASGTRREPRRRTRWWWSYPRATAWAGCAFPLADTGVRREVVVMSVHLDVDAVGRAAHVARVLEQVEALDAEIPVVIAGDLNESGGGPSWLALATRLDLVGDDAPTYPVRPPLAPRHRIDAIWSRGLTKVSGAGGVLDTAADSARGRGRPVSDHRPVLVVLRAR